MDFAVRCVTTIVIPAVWQQNQLGRRFRFARITRAHVQGLCRSYALFFQQFPLEAAHILCHSSSDAGATRQNVLVVLQ
jgi:hypothetical protein